MRPLPPLLDCAWQGPGYSGPVYDRAWWYLLRHFHPNRGGRYRDRTWPDYATHWDERFCGEIRGQGCRTLDDICRCLAVCSGRFGGAGTGHRLSGNRALVAVKNVGIGAPAD